MTLSYIFEGTEIFSYEKDPTTEDIADYLGCDEDEAQMIAEGGEVDGLPTMDELLEEEYDFINYMQDHYRWDAYQKWEESNR